MRFVRCGKLLDRRSDELSTATDQTLHFVCQVSSAYVGYLLNVKQWPKLSTGFSAFLPWESLWDGSKSLQELSISSTQMKDPKLFDEHSLYSHRDEDRFLKTISPLTPEEFHWRARCLSPGAGCVWSPETDKYWPMLFRKIIRYCLQIRVAAGVAGVGHLPHGIVSIIGSFL